MNIIAYLNLHLHVVSHMVNTNNNNNMNNNYPQYPSSGWTAYGASILMPMAFADLDLGLPKTLPG